MKHFNSPLFRKVAFLVLVMGLLVASAGAAFANNRAYTWQNETDTFVAYGTCSDPNGAYQITIVSTGAIHFIENNNGLKFHWSEHGTANLVPVAANSPVTYSGRYATSLQEIVNPNTYVFKNAFTNVAYGSDGTHETFHVTFQIVDTPNGPERVIENFQWICN